MDKKSQEDKPKKVKKPRKPKPLLTGNEVFLTVEEAAVLLRIGRHAAYQAAERDEIPGIVRLGRLIRVRKSVLLGTAPGVMPE